MYWLALLLCHGEGGLAREIEVHTTRRQDRRQRPRACARKLEPTKGSGTAVSSESQAKNTLFE